MDGFTSHPPSFDIMIHSSDTDNQFTCRSIDVCNCLGKYTCISLRTDTNLSDSISWDSDGRDYFIFTSPSMFILSAITCTCTCVLS